MGLLLARLCPALTAALPATVLPQFAYGGGWYSALYFTNFSSTAVSFPVSFVRDGGTPLAVPSLGGATATVNLAAHGTAVLEAPNSGALVQGYAAFTLPDGVTGYGVFRQSVPGQLDQEAVVPLSDAGASSTYLTWDETNFTTAVAMVNPSLTAAQIQVTVWDDGGNVIGRASVSLPPMNKTATVLRSLAGLAGMAGKRGTAQFTAVGGSIAVLGLRFNGLAFTSIPSTAGTGAANPANAVLPQIAFGGGWYSALYFSNYTDSPVSFAVNFAADGGVPLTVPSLGATAVQVNLPAHGTTVLEMPNAGALTQGYASLTLPVGVSGYGVFRQSVPGQIDQEAVVPLSDPGALSSTLTWDEANLTTAVAMVNPGSTTANVTVTVWDESGTVLGTSAVTLPGNNKTATVLRSLPGLSANSGRRGSAQFTTTGGNIAVLGLRFDGLAFTSIPATNFHAAAAAGAVAERALAQTGLAIAQASTVLQSQLHIAIAIASGGTACSMLDGGGSVRQQSYGGTAVTIYYDNNCTKPYLATDPSTTFRQDGAGSIVMNETATYYGLNGTVLGTMAMNETAVIGDVWNVYGLGTFVPATGGRTPVQLGLYCSLSQASTACAGGIAQDLPALGMAAGAITQIALTFGQTAHDPITFSGGGAPVTGPPGALMLNNPSANSLTITGGSNYGSTTCKGGAASFALFPPTPTAWSLNDAGHDLQFQISVVSPAVRNLTFTITQMSSGAVVATGALDQSGTGTISYSNGGKAVIANWVLAD